MSYDYAFKVLVVGESNVGKTNIMTRFCQSEFDRNSSATIGVAYQHKIINIDVDSQNYDIKLTIWDTAGQEKFKSLTTTYYRGAEGAIIVYDITNIVSFNKIHDYIFLVQQHTPNAQILIVGNKTDLEDKRQVLFVEGISQAEKYRCMSMETSALDGYNIQQSFMHLTTEMVKRKLEAQEKKALNDVIKCQNKGWQRQQDISN